VLAVKAMFQSFQQGAPVAFEGAHYRFTLLPPFFNPGPIDHPAPPIYVAAVNRYLCRLAGELCEGVRLHPIGTFRYVRDVVLPTITAGAEKAGRTLADVDVVGAPFLAIGSNEAEVAKAKQAVKQHIAFYASTRTYHAVLAHHGWESAGLELHRLSREGKWGEMASVISDDMLEQWAVIATYDQLAATLTARCRGLFATILLDLPARLLADDRATRAIVEQLHNDAQP